MKSKCYLFLFLFVLGSLNGLAQWQQLTSLEGGTVNDLEHIDHTIWAATNGGLFKSTDEGKTWIRDEAFPASWAVLDISPVDDMIFVILSELTPFMPGDDAKHVYRSRDGGLSWERILTRTRENPFYKVYEVFRIDEVLFVVFGNIAVLSDDDGKTWHDINYFENGHIGFPFALGHDANNILVTTLWGVYLSKDHGHTWDSLGPMLSEVAPILEDSLIIVLAYDSLYTSHDLGKSWQQFPLPTYFLASVQRGSSGKLYARDYLVYASEDNGASWDTLNTEYYNMPGDILELSGGELIIATDVGFYTTSQQGSVWHASNAGFVAANIWSLFIGPSGEYFASTNLGRLRSTDAGQNWYPWNFPLSEYPVQMEWISDDSVFIRTNRRKLFLATDNVQAYQSILASMLIDRIEISDDVIYLQPWFGESLLASRDFGMTWETLDLPPIDRLYAFTVIGQSIILIDDRRMWRSPDGGETWTLALQTDFTSWRYSMIHDTGKRIFVTNRCQWFFSDTNGETWEEFNPLGLPASAPEVLFMTGIDDVLFALIPAQGVYISYDLGDHWQPFNDGLETLRGRMLAYANDILALGTSHGSIWLRDISTTLNIPMHDLAQKLLIYPVPGDGVFHFILPKSVHGKAILEIYDLNAQRVYSSGIEAIYGTLPELHTDLLAGAYLAVLTYKGQRYVGKMMVAR